MSKDTQKRPWKIRFKKSTLCAPFQLYNLEEALNSTKVEYGQRLGPLNRAILHLQAELRKMRAQVERHVENNNNLLCVKMKLETEMDNYQRLLQGITADPERWEVTHMMSWRLDASYWLKYNHISSAEVK